MCSVSYTHLDVYKRQVKRQLQRISLGSLFFIIGAISIFAQPKTMVSGKVISKEKQEVVDFATVYLKGTTYGCTTNEEGIAICK